MKNLNINLNLATYEGPATNDPADGDRLLNAFEELVTSVYRQQVVIADNTTDQVIPLPSNPSDFLFILTTRDLTMKMNGGAAEVLKTRANGKKTFAYFKRGSITSLTISNGSGGDAEVDILLIKK